MLTKDEALQIAEAEVSRIADGGARFMRESTIDLEYGWLFFWNSAAFLETRDRRLALIGNAPLLVNKTDGTFAFTGTAHTPGHYLREYEERTGLRPAPTPVRILRQVLGELWLRALSRRWTTSLLTTNDCDCLRCRLSLPPSHRKQLGRSASR